MPNCSKKKRVVYSPPWVLLRFFLTAIIVGKKQFCGRLIELTFCCYEVRLHSISATPWFLLARRYKNATMHPLMNAIIPPPHTPSAVTRATERHCSFIGGAVVEEACWNKKNNEKQWDWTLHGPIKRIGWCCWPFRLIAWETETWLSACKDESEEILNFNFHLIAQSNLDRVKSHTEFCYMIALQGK